jgi:hypothetical protein
LVSGAGVAVAAVMRSASALAAASFASIIPLSEFAGPAVGCGSATLPGDALTSAAAALRAGSGRACDETGGRGGARDAAVAAFAAGMVGFAVLLARRARWRT